MFVATPQRRRGETQKVYAHNATRVVHKVQLAASARACLTHKSEQTAFCANSAFCFSRNSLCCVRSDNDFADQISLFTPPFLRRVN